MAVYPFFHPYHTILDFEKTYTVRLMGEIDLLIRPRSSYMRKIEIPHSLQSTRQHACKNAVYKTNKTSNIHASSYWAHFITRTPKNDTRILNTYRFRRIRNLSDKRGLVPSSYCFMTYQYPHPFLNNKNDSQNDPCHTLF